jgi:hypothetical protein
MTTKIGKNHFSAMSKVYGAGPDTLVHIVRELAQHNAKAALASTTALTDNSGGTSGGNTLGKVDLLTPFTTSDTDMAGKSGWDTAWGKVRNALATLAGRVNTIYAIVPVVQLTDNTGGTDGSGTIASIGTVGTAVASAGVSVADANGDIADARDVLKTLGLAVNRVATACGEDTIDLSALVGQAGDWTLKALDATTGTAVDGSADTGVAKADADAILGQFADAVATLAAKLDACVDGNDVPVTVVAI